MAREHAELRLFHTRGQRWCNKYFFSYFFTVDLKRSVTLQADFKRIVSSEVNETVDFG